MATTRIDIVISHLSGYVPLGWRLTNYRTCGPCVHPVLFLHVSEVLGDALGPGDVLTDAATRGLGVTASTAKRTASPGTLPTGTLPVLNQSSGEAVGGQCWEGWVSMGFIASFWFCVFASTSGLVDGCIGAEYFEVIANEMRLYETMPFKTWASTVFQFRDSKWLQWPTQTV